jgi:hypothetical protein
MNPWGKEGRNSSNRLEVNIYDCPFKEDWKSSMVQWIAEIYPEIEHGSVDSRNLSRAS